MTALVADIGPALRAALSVTHEDPAIKAAHPLAIDASVSPATGFFDDPADAQAVIDARAALVAPDRAHLQAVVNDLLWIDPTTGLPCFHAIDGEIGVDATFLAMRLELDLDPETSNLELYG